MVDIVNMLLKYYCLVNILVCVAAQMNFRSQHNAPKSKYVDKNEHRKEQLYNEVVSNISKVNTIIEDLIVNYEKLKNLYKSEEKISDYSSDAEVDQVYKQKRAKGPDEAIKKTTTKNPFDVATEMFFSEEKDNNDDNESDNDTENKSEETTTLEVPMKIERNYKDKAKTEKGKIEKLNEEYLERKKYDYDIQKTDDILNIASETNTTYETTRKSTYSAMKKKGYPVIGSYDVIESTTATKVKQTTTQSLYSNVNKLSKKRVDEFIDLDSQEYIKNIKKPTGESKIFSEKEKNNSSEEKDNFKKQESEKNYTFQSNPENGSLIKNESDEDRITKPIPYEEDIYDVHSPEKNEKESGIEDQENNNKAEKENGFQADTEVIDNNEHKEQEDNINKESVKISKEIKKVKLSRIIRTTQETTTQKIARMDEPGFILSDQDGEPIKDFLTKDLFPVPKHNIVNKNPLLSNKVKGFKSNDRKREKYNFDSIKNKKQAAQVNFVFKDKQNSERDIDVEDNTASDVTVESSGGTYEDSASMESESDDPVNIISNDDDEEIGKNNKSPLRNVKETETDTDPPLNKYLVQNHEIQPVPEPNDAYKSRFSISSRNNNTDIIYRQRVQSLGVNALRQKSSPVNVEREIHLDQYRDPWDNKHTTPTSLQTAHQQPRIFFKDQLPRSIKATTSTLLKVISDFYKTNKHLQHAGEVLFRRLENNERSNSLDDDDIIKKEQLQTRILRKAYGDACLKVVVRKCYKACKAASKDTCVKYNCKEPFKTAFKKNAKKTCIAEFAENLYQRKGEGSLKTNLVDITRNGYLAAACLPMTKEKKPPLRSNASIEEFGPFIQLNILRDRFEKACQQASSEKCTKACSEAVTQACDETQCQGHKKDYFKKQCKKDCKTSYRGKKHIKSKDSSSSSEDKHKKRKRCKKGSKCKKHKKSKESSSSGSSSESDSSDSTDLELNVGATKPSGDQLSQDLKDSKVGEPKESKVNKEEAVIKENNETKEEKKTLKEENKQTAKEENKENRKTTAKEDQDTEEDEDSEEIALFKEKDVSTELIRQNKPKKQKQKKKHKEGKKPKRNETKAEN